VTPPSTRHGQWTLSGSVRKRSFSSATVHVVRLALLEICPLRTRPRVRRSHCGRADRRSSEPCSDALRGTAQTCRPNKQESRTHIGLRKRAILAFFSLYRNEHIPYVAQRMLFPQNYDLALLLSKQNRIHYLPVEKHFRHLSVPAESLPPPIHRGTVETSKNLADSRHCNKRTSPGV